MPNAIKYSASAQTLALKKGDYWIGTGDVGKGPTSTTDYWNGITPPSGGYTIYLNKASNGPSIYTAANDTDLISLTNRIANASYTTAAECFNYFRGQNDKMVFNIDYPSIVTDGLVLNLDAGFRSSYTTSGTTWYDLSGNARNGTLTNGPTFSSSDGGSIAFDGTNDYVDISGTVISNSNTVTFLVWFKRNGAQTGGDAILFNRFGGLTAAGMAMYDSTKLGYNWRDDFNAYGFDSGLVIPNNTWAQLAVAISPTNANLYVNTSKATNTITHSAQSLEQVWISRDTGGNGQRWITGNVAIAMIYSRTLNDTEIQQNYNAVKSRFGL